MKVSIVVPVYKAECYIERCARSLFSQTYEDIEIIFVIDGSPDRSLDILNEVLSKYTSVKNKVTLLVHSQNLGCAISRKEGMNSSTGEFILQVDSDDYVAPNYVEDLVESAVKNKSDVVICDYYLDYISHLHRVNVTPPLEPQKCLSLLLDGSMHNGLWNKLIRRSILVENNIEPHENIRFLDDKLISTPVMYFAKRISYVPKALYYYNKLNPNSVSADSKDCYAQDFKTAISYIDAFFNDKECDSSIYRSIDHFRVSIVANLLLYADRQEKAYMDQMLSGLSFRTIFTQPVIPAYYKVALFVYKLHIPFRYQLIRMTVSMSKNILRFKKSL